MPTPVIPLAPEKKFAIELALHDAELTISANHQEDFARLVKVLTQINGFRLYFAEISHLPYRDQLIAQLAEILHLAGKPAKQLDLSTQTQTPALTFEEFEERVLAAESGSVLHVLNSELWLVEHVAELNIRRNAIASRAQCALVWWLPRSAMQNVAQHAPDAWSWRHGVFGFAGGQKNVPVLDQRQFGASLLDEYGFVAGSMPQISKRSAELRQLLAQEMDDDLRYQLVVEMVELLLHTGHLDAALDLLHQQALPLAQAMAVEKPMAEAYVKDQIAEILFRRGDLDEALRIRREEQLPVVAQHGNERAYAITMGKIANILTLRGELDEALRIRREEELPVFAKRGEVREYAICMGYIADIFYVRSEFDEALRIRREEELPVYSKLGDVRAYAICMGKIADIHYQRGELDEALRIHCEEGLPIYAKQGDVRVYALTLAKIADIYSGRGELDEALLLRHEEVIPALEKLGDSRGLMSANWWQASNLLKRARHGDIAQAKQHLQLALQYAEKLRLSEVAEIKQWLADLPAED